MPTKPQDFATKKILNLASLLATADASAFPPSDCPRFRHIYCRVVDSRKPVEKKKPFLRRTFILPERT